MKHIGRHSNQRTGSTERLGDIITSLLQRRPYARTLALAGMREAWRKAAGERLAKRSRVAGFRSGVLTVEVESAAQRYELEAFRGPEILTRLQQDGEIPPVQRLVFRVGQCQS